MCSICEVEMILLQVKNRTTFGYQLDRRVREMCCWPYAWLRTRRQWKNDAFVNRSVVYLWSSIWKVAIDILIGICMSLFLTAYTVSVLRILRRGGQILHLDVLRTQIIWLMGLPAGMKLNVHLNFRLGSAVLYGNYTLLPFFTSTQYHQCCTTDRY